MTKLGALDADRSSLRLRGEVSASHADGGVIGNATDAHDPSVADRVLSHEVRKYRRATSPRYAQGGIRSRTASLGAPLAVEEHAA